MTNLARAYLEILPSMKGMGGAIRKELEGIVSQPLTPKGEPPVPQSWSRQVQSYGQSWQSAGGQISGVGSQIGGLTAPLGLAAAGAAGLTGALGWKRLQSVDTAQSQLKGLGYDAQDVERISGQLAEALEGGMMTMGEATSAAASGMAAGVEEGQELTKYIQLLDAAVVGGSGSFDEMNQIFSRVQSQGKLTRTEFDMMEQRMPGFSSAVQEAMGVSTEEMYNMLSNGEITSEDFLSIMDDFAGGMAESYAGSMEGMVQNTMAYVGIIGEQLLGGVFAQSKDSIEEFLDFLSSDDVQAWAAETGALIGDVFTSILGIVKDVINWFMNLDSSWQKTILAAVGIVTALGPFLLIVGKIVSTVGGLIAAFGTIIGWISKLSVVFTAIGKVIGIATTAFRLLGVAMMANPIGLIIGLVAALVGALIWFFTQTDLGREIWSSFMDWLGVAWQWIKDTAVAVFNAVVDGIVAAWNWVRDTSIAVWDAVTGALVAAWNWIRDTAVAVWDGLVGAITGAWDWISESTSAAWNWIVDLIKGVWNKITSDVRIAVDTVRGWISGAWNTIRDTTGNVFNAIWSTISGIFNRVRSTVSSAVQAVVNFVRNAWNNARNLTSSAFDNIRNAVSNGINGAVNFVRGLPGRVRSALGNLGSLLLGSGRALIDGFTRGIRNAFGNAVNAVKSGVQRVRNFFPFSPAKEGPFSGSGYTSFSGEALVSDFAAGMAAAEADVVRQAEAITRAAAFEPPVPPMSPVSGGAYSDGAQVAHSGGVTNNFSVVNPQAEPTSETVRKASAYIGVTV